MKKNLYVVLTMLLIAMLAATPVLARGAISLSGSSLGSLKINGDAIAGGNSDYFVNLLASGPGLVVCTNKGGETAPGRNYPHIEEMGQVKLDTLDGANPKNKPGKRVFDVETVNSTAEISWDAAGCPNANWTAKLIFVFWEEGTLTLTDASGNTVAKLNIGCETKYKPQNDGYTFDDGTVSCWEK